MECGPHQDKVMVLLMSDDNGHHDISQSEYLFITNRLNLQYLNNVWTFLEPQIIWTDNCLFGPKAGFSFLSGPQVMLVAYLAVHSTFSHRLQGKREG